MLEQHMHICTVCAAERSASRHHMLKHNGKMNLPMSTGREPNLLKRQARTIPRTSMDQSRTLGEHCEKEENQYELYHTKTDS